MNNLALILARADGGAAAVEFALIAPLLLLMILGVTELGKIVYYRSVLESAARAGIQKAFTSTLTSSSGRTTAQTNMETAADLAITNSGIGGTVTSTAVVTCECSDFSVITCVTGTCVTGSVRYIATVTMTRTYTPLFNMTNLPFGYNIDLNITLTGNSIMWVK